MSLRHDMLTIYSKITAISRLRNSMGFVRLNLSVITMYNVHASNVKPSNTYSQLRDPKHFFGKIHGIALL